MAEVQFVSDLVMNMIEGLQDFSASKLDNYYEAHEEEFAEEQDVKKRLDRIYTQVLGLPAGTIKSTVFHRPQVLFSLFLVLDGLSSAPSAADLRRCIEDLDARFNAFQTGQNVKAMTPDVYESFNVGNMHRIKYRRLRRDAIKRYLEIELADT